MYRLGLEKDWLTRESEYMEFADMALEAGSPAEAQKVYEAAVAKMFAEFPPGSVPAQ